jgi:hypothetical protein
MTAKGTWCRCVMHAVGGPGAFIVENNDKSDILFLHI